MRARMQADLRNSHKTPFGIKNYATSIVKENVEIMNTCAFIHVVCKMALMRSLHRQNFE